MDFRDVLNKRRAVNFFNPEKDVPEALLKTIIEQAAKTPSSFNLQPWSVIVLRDKKDKRRLQKRAMDQAKVSEAPVTLIVLADRHGWNETYPFADKVFDEMLAHEAAATDKPPLDEDAREKKQNWFAGVKKKMYGKTMDSELAFACKNTGFFAMSLMLAAKNAGLDTHPMDGFDHDGVREEFNIPDHYWVPLLIAVGYFDDTKTLSPPKWRKGYEDIVLRFD